MFTHIKKAIDNSNNIIILPHISADGDCLGSAFALKLILKGLGKNVVVKTAENEQHRICNVLYGVEPEAQISADLVITVDCADIERLGDRVSYFNNCNLTVNIDHHPTNTNFALHNYVNSDAAATGEIIYELAQFMECKMTLEIATNIYVAIVSDTGGFKYSNAKSHTFSIAAQLIQFGFNHAFINKFLFETNSLAGLLAMREALKSLEVHYDGKIALVSITKEQIESIGAKDSDTSGLISLPRSLETAIVAMSFKENDDGIKVSLRSGSIDVSALASKFGGGGHVRASGCTINADMETAKKALIEEATKRIKLEVRVGQ